MKKCFTIIFLISALHSFSQDWQLRKIISAKKEQKVPFTPIAPFSFVANKKITGAGTYQQLRLNPSFSIQVLAQKPQAIQLSVPLINGKTLVCELVQFSLGNVQYTQNNNIFLQDIKVPVTYRGIISGEAGKNMVVLTVNNESLSLMAVTNANRVFQVTKADEPDNNIYRLYDSRNISFPKPVAFDCGTADRADAKTANGIDITGTVLRPQAAAAKCINVFVDCFDSLYQWCSNSRQRTVNYVYELFNSVTTGYLNEQVNIQITTINVWTTADPYRGDNRANALADLAAHYKDNFWGNICVGLDYSLSGQGRSGLAGAIGRVKAVSTNTCPAYTVSDNPFCYCELNYNVTVANFPTGPNTTGQQVYLVMHEMGHLLGAHHTKWCGWKISSNPDVYGALDSCGTVEGTCAKGPPPGSGGATIMSYCVTGNDPNQYVNYYNGFGLLPGNAIRNFIDQSSCLLNCSDCFGSILKAGNKNSIAANISYPVKYPGQNSWPANRGHSGMPINKTTLLITPQIIKQ